MLCRIPRPASRIPRPDRPDRADRRLPGRTPVLRRRPLPPWSGLGESLPRARRDGCRPVLAHPFGCLPANALTCPTQGADAGLLDPLHELRSRVRTSGAWTYRQMAGGGAGRWPSPVGTARAQPLRPGRYPRPRPAPPPTPRYRSVLFAGDSNTRTLACTENTGKITRVLAAERTAGPVAGVPKPKGRTHARPWSQLISIPESSRSRTRP